jgi:hypothetical protein
MVRVVVVMQVQTIKSAGSAGSAVELSCYVFQVVVIPIPSNNH